MRDHEVKILASGVNYFPRRLFEYVRQPDNVKGLTGKKKTGSST